MKVPRGLVVEDDVHLANAIGAMLTKLGLQTTVVHSVKAATKAIETDEYTLGVVDRLLTDGDGLQVVEYAREIQYPMKVLMLSDKNNLSDRVGGLEKGASDYVGKPFSYKELELRLERLVLSDKLQESKSFRYRELLLYPATGELVVGKNRVQLRSRETKILEYMIRHQRQVVTREMLIDYIWGNGEFVPDYQTIEVYVRRLRMKLGVCKQYLKTVRSFGFKLE
jgi:two-component system, OmpR family, copper resistance phosphate regulon response regulator CusR